MSISATAIPTGNTQAQILLNRNVGAQSLDITPTATISFLMEFSLDGGVTWGFGAGGGTKGGQLAGEITDVEVMLPGNPANAARQVRGTVTNGAVALSVSGSLNLS